MTAGFTKDAFTTDGFVTENGLRTTSTFILKRITTAYLTIRSASSYLTKRDNTDGDLP